MLLISAIINVWTVFMPSTPWLIVDMTWMIEEYYAGSSLLLEQIFEVNLLMINPSELLT